MNVLYILVAGVALLSAQPDNATVTCKDATPAIQPYYRNLARKLAIKPALMPTGGNDFEIIRAGKRYSELLFSDLESAKDLIELEVFLFGEDKDGKRVRDVLVDKVAQGVTVRYIHDNFGNFFDNAFDGRPNFTGYYRNMRKSGIDVRQHSPLWRPDYTYTDPIYRNHRKINLIDKKTAYVGGMNLSEGSMSGWGDTQIRITGPAVQCVREIFLEDWSRVGPKASETGAPAPDGEREGKILQFVADGPDQPAYMMEEVIVWLLEHAKEYVWFETPYFLPTRPVMKAMSKAAERGVDVRVIAPEVTDMTSFDSAFHATAKECVKSGIKLLYRKPPFNHSKTLVCDDYITCVGSSNLDKLSLQSLYEINVLIYDSSAAIDHKAYLTEAQEGAKIADQDYIDSWSASERFKQSLLGIISPWL
ncbi:MAG: phosphatidylserine/phosphatidylglycerophosphate/cardiolipin synthase family protein [Bacteroidales bacterium]|nr:phosphatidylserine/phosphatidylglycerophosphate/cardiolipin synthase family protein [Bacteroidales bacterium]